MVRIGFKYHIYQYGYEVVCALFLVHMPDQTCSDTAGRCRVSERADDMCMCWRTKYDLATVQDTDELVSRGLVVIDL